MDFRDRQDVRGRLVETIELREVTKTYEGRHALWRFSALFQAGTNTAIIGPSGSGKSTLLRLAAGLEPPTAGEIYLAGTTASKPGKVLIAPHERRLSMVFQDLALWPNLSVIDNVLLGLCGLRLPRREARDRALNVLSLCGIDSLSRRKPGSLSGGEQQRAALARALAVRPGFLLLDEPFSGLDLVTKHRLLEEIAALSREKGVTVILVTHDPMDALALCSWGIVLNGGQAEGSGELDRLLESSDTDILRLFRERKRT